MSTRYDILKAKAEFNEHVATHGCRTSAAHIADGQEPCQERIELLQAYMGMASLWGQEPDDDRRQREHYERNVARPAA